MTASARTRLGQYTAQERDQTNQLRRVIFSTSLEEAGGPSWSFLGFCKNADGRKERLFWSSQKERTAWVHVATLDRSPR